MADVNSEMMQVCPVRPDRFASWFVKRASGSTRDSFSSVHCIIRIFLSNAKDWQL